MKYLKLIFFLIIFNHINSANCKLTQFSPNDFKTFFIGNKLYFLGKEFFYVDLEGISLDNETLVEPSKWINLTDIKPRPEKVDFGNPILGGKANDQIMFIDMDVSRVNSFDTTTKQWVLNQEVKLLNAGLFNINVKFADNWVSDKKIGKAYSLYTGEFAMFDTINLSVTKGVTPSRNPFVSYDSFVPVLLSNGQILYVGGRLGKGTAPMKSLLTYDTIKSTWQMMNTAGIEPGGRISHTAVSTSDGRVIVYGGSSIERPPVPASPHLAVLDTSKTPYEWSTPKEENPINPIEGFREHSAVMVNNYMIFAFGLNQSSIASHFLLNNNIYKLDVSDPLKYKWSLLAKFDPSTTNSPPNVPPNAPPNTSPKSSGAGTFLKNFGLKSNLIFVITVVVVVNCL